MARESKRLKRELDVKEEQMQSLEGYVQKLHDSGYIDSEGTRFKSSSSSSSYCSCLSEAGPLQPYEALQQLRSPYK